MATANRTVSVVIPFFNRRDDVVPCLESVAAQVVPPGWDVEIVAVDNGSTDSTREELTRQNCLIVDCAKRGPAAARNAGIARSRGEIIALLDSDCRARRGWLAALLEPFADPGVAIAGGILRDRDQPTGVARFAEEFGVLNQEAFFCGGAGMPPFVVTANAAVRRVAWERVGGFNEALFVGEDADFCWRAMDQGGDLALAPKAIASHRHRETFAGLFAWGLSYGEGTARLHSLHRERLGAGPHFAWGYYPALAAAPVAIAWALCFGEHLHDRRRPIYETVYRAGLVLGRWRGSLKYGVACF